MSVVVFGFFLTLWKRILYLNVHRNHHLSPRHVLNFNFNLMLLSQQNVQSFVLTAKHNKEYPKVILKFLFYGRIFHPSEGMKIPSFYHMQTLEILKSLGCTECVFTGKLISICHLHAVYLSSSHSPFKVGIKKLYLGV